MSFHLLTASKTHPGRIRKINEDSIFSFVRDRQKGDMLALLSVADGIGGHKAGDIASKMAIDTIFQSLAWFLDKNQAEDTKPVNFIRINTSGLQIHNHIEKRLKLAFEEANTQIYEYGRTHPEASNLGTTLTCALVWGDNVVIAHVGDSRAYLLRKGTLRQLTEDHSFVGQMVRQGQLPHEAYYVHPRRNVITRALGQFPDISVDVRTERLEADDRLLLCSDGLWEMLRDPEIKDYLASNHDLEHIVLEMVQQAIANGGPDNISAIVAKIVAKPDDR